MGKFEDIVYRATQNVMTCCLFILHNPLPFPIPAVPSAILLLAFLSSTVPSGPPLNVRAEPGGGGSVVVTWTPPTGEISGYIIVYGPKDAQPTETVNVDNPAVTAHTLEDIAPETEYTVEMWAYLELPSSRSQPTTIHLDGENLYKVYGHSSTDLLVCDGKQWKVL